MPEGTPQLACTFTHYFNYRIEKNSFMIRKSFPPFSLNLFTAACLALTLQGCSTTNKVNNQLTDAEACGALKNVIAQAGSDFNQLKGTRITAYDHTRWDTRSIFPKADCDIIGWSTGKTNYACTWNKSSELEARNDYANGLKLASSCLGPSWTASDIKGVTGEGQRFTTAGSSTAVEVRVHQEQKPSTDWQTSLSVGAAIHPDGH